MSMKTEIDLGQLREEIRVMERSDPLYIVLRDELRLRGWWRMRGRGDPAKGYRVTHFDKSVEGEV